MYYGSGTVDKIDIGLSAHAACSTHQMAVLFCVK